MDERSKIIIYKQLMKYEIIAKMKNEGPMEWENFAKLEDTEILRYAFSYRDKALEKFREMKNSKQNEKEFYLELPDMNLEGQDLSGLYIHMFMVGFSKERNNGKMIFITSSVNLKDTNCVINFASLRPIVISEDGENIKEISADITKCDFRGCIIFGKFQNSKAKLEYKEENLPRKYIDRLMNYKVPESVEVVTDIVYINMIEGRNLKGLKEVDKVKQIVDFDLTSVKKNIWKYKDVIVKNEINISYTGAFISQYGLKSIGMENYYIDSETHAKDAYGEGNMAYIEEVYDDLSKDTKKKILALALRDRKNRFYKETSKRIRFFAEKIFRSTRKGTRSYKNGRAVKRGFKAKI